VALLVQLIGSTLVLVGFVAGQAGRLTPTSRRYLALNTIGSLGLAASALVESQWGFLVLEAAWFAVSLDGLRRSLRAPRPRAEDR
jgi:hypothetical protein